MLRFIDITALLICARRDSLTIHVKMIFQLTENLI